jgi:hypothetical protein
MGSATSYSHMHVSQPDLENVKPGQIGKQTVLQTELSIFLLDIYVSAELKLATQLT